VLVSKHLQALLGVEQRLEETLTALSGSCQSGSLWICRAVPVLYGSAQHALHVMARTGVVPHAAALAGCVDVIKPHNQLV
jgi:hypothetical protein